MHKSTDEMDLLDRIKQFINESIQSLFVRQKEDFTLIVHKELKSVVSDLKTFASQQMQTNERDIANMLQTVFSLNQNVENLLRRLDAIQKTIDQFKSNHEELFLSEKKGQKAPPTSIITVYYAKMVDSVNPLGFKMDNLKRTEEGCAFKIILTDGSEGNYQFVDDSEIHQEMLAAFNPLISESSVYDAVPHNPTCISVVIPGTVVKENNILRIVDKQKIEID